MELFNTLFVCGPIDVVSVAFLYGALTSINFYNNIFPYKTIVISLLSGLVTSLMTAVLVELFNPGYLVTMVVTYMYLFGFLYRLVITSYTFYTGLITKHTCKQCNSNNNIEFTFGPFSIKYQIGKINVITGTEFVQGVPGKQQVEDKQEEEEKEGDGEEDSMEDFGSEEESEEDNESSDIENVSDMNDESNKLSTSDVTEPTNATNLIEDYSNQVVDEPITSSSEEKPSPLSNE